MEKEWGMEDILREVGKFRELKRKAVEEEFRGKRTSRRICSEDVGLGSSG